MPQRPQMWWHVWKPIKPCGKHIGAIDTYFAYITGISNPSSSGFGTSLFAAVSILSSSTIDLGRLVSLSHDVLRLSANARAAGERSNEIHASTVIEPDWKNE